MADKYINPADLQEIKTWVLDKLSDKQDELVSGTNIKTINSTSLLGSGDIEISGGDGNDEVFIAIVNQTTAQEIYDAVRDNKVVWVSNGTYQLRPVVYINATPGAVATRGANLYIGSDYDRTSAHYHISEEDDTWTYYAGEQIILRNYVTDTISDNNSNPPQTKAVKSYVDNAVSSKQDSLVSGTNIKTVNGQSLLGSGNIAITSSADTTMSDTSTNPVQNKVIKSYVDNATSDLQFQIDGLGEPFRLLDFTQTFSAGLTIPSCNQNLANTAIANVDVDLNVIDSSGALNRDFAVAGLLKYEIYDAVSGGNRLNCWPVTTFSMSGQQTLRIRMMCAGTTNQIMKRIQGTVLLKHR